MTHLLVKTPAGQQEMRARTLALARPARTLLVLADGTRSGEQLLGMVQGSTPADLSALVESGLVVEAAGSTRKTAPAGERASPPVAAETPEAGSELGYQELYDSLNALCKEQLGLIKGLRFSLEIEKAEGLEGLQAVARRFVAEVHKVKGDSAAQMIRRALGMTT